MRCESKVLFRWSGWVWRMRRKWNFWMLEVSDTIVIWKQLRIHYCIVIFLVTGMGITITSHPWTLWCSTLGLGLGSLEFCLGVFFVGKWAPKPAALTFGSHFFDVLLCFMVFLKVKWEWSHCQSFHGMGRNGILSKRWVLFLFLLVRSLENQWLEPIPEQTPWKRALETGDIYHNVMAWFPSVSFNIWAIQVWGNKFRFGEMVDQKHGMGISSILFNFTGETPPETFGFFLHHLGRLKISRTEEQCQIGSSSMGFLTGIQAEKHVILKATTHEVIFLRLKNWPSW